MMVQYYEIKKEYPDCLLFYRMGDFYEMFGEDAVVGSKALEITLTGKNAGPEGRIPMCGVPFHACDSYIAKLIEQGFKVAICEQVEDPKLAKGLVKRDVVRVITPGTVVDGNLLKASDANYLAAVFPCAKGYGIAYSDISTGEFMVSQVNGEGAVYKIGDELSRINPSECVLPNSLLQEEFFSLHVWDSESSIVLTPVEDELFIRQNAPELLMTHFKVGSMEGLGLKDLNGAILAAAALLNVIYTTQKRELSYINNLQVYSIDNYLIMDANTRRNLELTSTMRNNKKAGSLYGVCDKTKTAAGSRLLKNWIEKPLLKAEEINLRLDGIDNIIAQPIVHENLKTELKEIYDLERLVGRMVYGNATPRDLIALKLSFGRLPDILSLVGILKAEVFKRLFDNLDPMEDLYELVDKTLKDEPAVSPKEGNLVKDGFSEEIDELRYITGEGKDWLLKLEADEKEKTGIKSLKVGFNKVFGYYLEVTKTNLDLVPDTYIRKQTLVNAERFITQELKEWENKILGAGEKLANLEYEIFNELREKIGKNTLRIQRTAKALAVLDCLVALASLAIENGYSRPVVNDEDEIRLSAARHPVVEMSIGRENYVPNDTFLNCGKNQFALITGPNMAGKSTYMRQVALAVIMARMGSYIPAQSGTIGLVDRIFTRVGASDDLAAGQSTFMVEMSETSNIIRNATKNSLIILDEIGRGTSTYDGLSIAWAVTEYILQPALGAKTLFATHYHELIQIADSYPQVKNYSVAVKEKGDTIVFLRQIVEGGTDKSYGIHVAELAGLPKVIIRRAKEILQQLEVNHSEGQISLSDFASHYAEPKTAVQSPILNEIENLNIADMRPVEALLLLEKWQNELREDVQS
ncbi:MAG: DNA mismatch repair protein MutS [Bacillota bacterium]